MSPTVRLGSRLLMAARAPEAAGPLGRALHGRLAHLERDVVREHHLGDAFTMDDTMRRRRVVANDHHPLFGIVGVDRSGSIGNRQRVLERLAAAWADLCLDVLRKARSEAERDEGHLARREVDPPRSVAL